MSQIKENIELKQTTCNAHLAFCGLPDLQLLSIFEEFCLSLPVEVGGGGHSPPHLWMLVAHSIAHSACALNHHYLEF